VAVKFLSDEYLAEVESRLNAHEGFQSAAKGQAAKLQNVVTGAPEGEVRYTFAIDGGKVSIGRGDLADAEATMTQDYDTATAMQKGELNGQAAFMQGKLKVTGNMMKLMQLQGAFTAMSGALGDMDIEY
jgi:putative sterol carrier protein